MPIANGQVSNRSTEASFTAKLTTGTALKFALSGTLDGTINGMPISGVGDVEYVLNFGATAWVKAKDTLVSSPDLPAGPIKFLPGPKSTGSARVATSGTVVNESGTILTSAKSKEVWPTKGRTALITIIPFDQGSTCDFADVCTGRTGATAKAYCDSNLPTCVECYTFVDTNCPDV